MINPFQDSIDALDVHLKDISDKDRASLEESASLDFGEVAASMTINSRAFANGSIALDASSWVYQTLKSWSRASLPARIICLHAVTAADKLYRESIDKHMRP